LDVSCMDRYVALPTVRHCGNKQVDIVRPLARL
jgi:hypothetical protein